MKLKYLVISTLVVTVDVKKLQLPFQQVLVYFQQRRLHAFISLLLLRHYHGMRCKRITGIAIFKVFEDRTFDTLQSPMLLKSLLFCTRNRCCDK